MGPVLNGQSRLAPSCVGVYELHHPSTGLQLLGITNDLAHTKRHLVKKLRSGLHENQELQGAFDADQNVDFVFYPAFNRACAQAMHDELLAELRLTGRLFEPTVRCVRPLDCKSPPHND